MRNIASPAIGVLMLSATIGCGSPSAPTSSSAPLSLAGTWSGTGSDTYGTETLTFALTQTGATLSGTVQMAPADPSDGSCGSCHKFKSGTFSGTLSGTALTMKVVFPAGGDVPTPMCAITFDVTANAVAANRINATYTGDDTCEKPFADGAFTMAR